MDSMPSDILSHFFVYLAVIVVITGIAVKLNRVLSRPRGTYGAGLPERRSRKRLVLRDPEVVMRERRNVPPSVA
jgi:hypothetical protein